MNRRDFMKATGVTTLSATLVAGAGTSEGGPAPKRPNVVLVMTDDQGYGDLGCLGNPVIQTPNLDKLHGESVFLNNFHVCPTCTPTRAALMTGRYSIRTGVWHTIMGRSLMRADEVTMADAFSAQGYDTAIFGKWHLGDNYPFRPQDRGFQEVLVHGGGGVGQTPDYWGNDYFDDTYFRNGEPEKHKGYCTDVWFDSALEFIEAHRDRPFFVYLPTNAPHGPYNVAEKYSALYDDKDVPNPAFYGMITNIDENMGRLVEALERLGLEENTILVFLTDNGSSSGAKFDKQGNLAKGFNAGMRGTKGNPYDGGHRVPCFIRWPAGGLTGARSIDELTAHIDLLPTLLDLCGLRPPEGVALDGVSLRPLLDGKEDPWPDRTICVDQQRIEHPEKWRNSVVMTEQWRLIKGGELYDVRTDPGQRANVAEKHPNIVEELRTAYEEWWNDVSVRFDKYCPIVLGADEENPVRLTCMDWHGPKVPWNQPHIREGMEANGFWAVEVAQDGDYEIALRRWPLEADAPINAAVPGGTAVAVTSARLQIGDADLTGPVPPDANAAVFQLPLKAGKTRLQTWFSDDGGASRGAYYVYVRRVS